MPFFSIIIPVYNVEKFLQECVNSVIEQLFKNYEIILIDDGSTDESGIMCDRFAENNKNIVSTGIEIGGFTAFDTKLSKILKVCKVIIKKYST